VPIIRRSNCIYATLGTCHSVWTSVWYAGFIPDSHPYRITSTKCRINTIVPLDDGHIVARNMQRKGINILRKIVHQFGFIYKITKKKNKKQNISSNSNRSVFTDNNVAQSCLVSYICLTACTLFMDLLFTTEILPEKSIGKFIINISENF
jgi:hypothetical protein